MAMDGNTLGSAIVAAVNGLSTADKADPTKCWQAIAGAIVSHIQANATVTIGTGVSGLQTSTTAGTATAAPLAPATIPAGCIG